MINPEYFDWGRRIQEGMQQSQENRRENAMLDLDKRRVSAYESQLASTEAKRLSDMTEAQRRESIGRRALMKDPSLLPELFPGFQADPNDPEDARETEYIYSQLAAAYGGFEPPQQAGLEQFTLGPGQARFGPDGKQIASVPFNSGGAGGYDPYYQVVPTAQGAMRFNARTGQMEPIVVDGKQVITATADPTLQGNIAASKKRGAVLGESWGGAEANLQQVVDKAEESIRVIEALPRHPGFKSVVGATLKPFWRFVEGSPEADFMRRLEQVQGAAFLEAYSTLKGGGQITEIEGRKATDAITRMSKSQGEEEFKQAAQDFIAVIRAGVERTKAIAAKGAAFGGGSQQQSATQEYDYVEGRGLVPRGK